MSPTPDRPVRVLLEGRPGRGKTTVARRLVQLIHRIPLTVAGFTTEEIREGRRRVGFLVEAVAGERATMAHVDLPGPPRVGRYGVDLDAFERIALPALEPPAHGVVILDELGKMELASRQFRDAVQRLFQSDVPVVATVHAYRHPLTDAVKARPDVDVLRVTARTRDRLPEELAERLRP